MIRFNQSEIDAIAQEYIDGSSLPTLRIKYKTSFNTLLKLLKQKGVKTRPCKKWSVDQRYFEKINSDEHGYYIGLIMSDGCLLETKNKEKAGILEITLQSKDSYVLTKMKESIQYTGPLYLKNNSKRNRQDTATLTICDYKFVEHLKKYGLNPRKSINHGFFTNIPDKFIPSALRGYFDGDGSVYITDNNRKLNVSLIGSVEFIDSLQIFLSLKKIKSRKRQRITKNNYIMSECRISGNKSCLRFYNLIYKNSTIHLHRKKSKFDYIIEMQKNGLIKDTN
jgi:hypothetical protein